MVSPCLIIPKYERFFERFGHQRNPDFWNRLPSHPSVGVLLPTLRHRCLIVFPCWLQVRETQNPNFEKAFHQPCETNISFVSHGSARIAARVVRTSTLQNGVTSLSMISLSRLRALAVRKCCCCCCCSFFGGQQNNHGACWIYLFVLVNYWVSSLGLLAHILERCLDMFRPR